MAEIDRELGELAREDPAARRLATIPGVGPITATALARRSATSAGSVPAAISQPIWASCPSSTASGGKERLGSDQPAGRRVSAQLLTHGARAVVRAWRAPDRTPAGDWIGRLLQRRPVNVAVAAQANRTARIVWALLAKAEDYRRPAAASREGPSRAPRPARVEQRRDGMTGRTGGRETPIRRTSLELVDSIGARLADHPSRPAAVRRDRRPDTRQQFAPSVPRFPRKPLQSGDRPYTCLI